MAARQGLVVVTWEGGRREEVLRIGRTTRSVERLSVPGLLVQAHAYWLGGLPDRAIPLLQTILQLDPANRGAHWVLAIGSCWARQDELAIQCGSEFLRKFGEDPELLLWMGVSHWARGELDEARGVLELCLSGFTATGGPNISDHTYLWIGWFFRRTGDEARAREVFRAGVADLERRVADSPDNLRVRGMLAWLYGSLGDRRALESERAAILGREPYGHAFWTLALGHAAIGEHAAAAELLREGLHHGAVDPVPLESARRLGVVDFDAIPAYREVLEDLVREETRIRATYAD